MATDGLPVERLRDYLRQLPSGARSLLVAELERAALRGDAIPGGEALLEEVRGAVRETGVRAPRIGDAVRLFFSVAEPFLIDHEPMHKHCGRIARSALPPIWTWISRDLAPGKADDFVAAAARALVADDIATCDSLSRKLQDYVAGRIRAAVAGTQSDAKARRQLTGQIGTPHAIEDIQDLATIFSARDPLAFVAGRLPDEIRNLADVELETVMALLEAPACGPRDLLPYSLVVVMGRLAAPWQMIRLAV